MSHSHDETMFEESESQNNKLNKHNNEKDQVEDDDNKQKTNPDNSFTTFKRISQSKIQPKTSNKAFIISFVTIIIESCES